MPESEIAERIAEWRQAGLIDAETAGRIESFEAARPPAAQRSGRITVSEVIAYIGAVVLLVGIGFLYGTQYENLGSAGRLVILALVTVAGLVAGTLVARIGGTSAARRARAAGWSVASVAAAALLAQFFVDNYILVRQPQVVYGGESLDTSGSLMVAAALGAIMAGVLLWRSGAALLALVTAVGLYTAAGFLDDYLRIEKPGWDAEVTWIVPALGVLALSETVARGVDRNWAREVLRFLVILPLLIVTLVISNASQAIDLELFAGVVAAAGFGLALARSSAGYAIAAGIGLFIFVNEVGFRHFSNTLGFPVVLIISGIALFAIAGGLVGILRRLQRRA